LDAPSTSAPKKPLSPAAERALAEAAGRRAERDRATAAGVGPPQRRTRPRPLRGLGGQGHRHRLL